MPLVDFIQNLFNCGWRLPPAIRGTWQPLVENRGEVLAGSETAGKRDFGGSFIFAIISYNFYQ
jgi:hypothetical protein